MDRIDISQVDRNRSIYFKIGLICALALAILTLNFTTYQARDASLYGEIEALTDLEDIPVVRTAHPKPKSLPPPRIATAEILPVEVIEEYAERSLLPETPELTEGPEVDFTPVAVPESRPAPPVLPVEEPENDNIPVIFAEEMPYFGDCKALPKAERQACSSRQLLTYLSQNIKYPALARENGIEGVVVVRFVVEKDGSISGLELVRDIGGGCGKEALRVVKAMPAWTPGLQRGRPVRVQFNLPVVFRLQ